MNKCSSYQKTMLLIDLFSNVIILDILHLRYFLVKEENNQTSFDKLREDSASSLKDSYIEMDFNVTQRAGDHARYADGDHKS